VVRTGTNLPFLLSYFTSNCPPEVHLKQSDAITNLQKTYWPTTLQSASDHIPRVASWWNTEHFQLSEFIFLTRYKVARDISDIIYMSHVRLTTNRASSLYTAGLYCTYLYLCSMLFQKCFGLCSAINREIIYTQIWELLLGLFVRFTCLDCATFYILT
jgi:hypothetical protein